MARGDRRTAPPLFVCAAAVAVARGTALPLTTPWRRRRTRVSVCRPRCTVHVTESTAEEELFIRRHAAASPPADAGAAAKPPPAAEDAEEHFDFVQDADPAGAPPLARAPPDVVAGAPAGPGDPAGASSAGGSDEKPATQRVAAPDRANTSVKGNGKEVRRERNVRVIVPPGLRGFAGRLRLETSRLFTESRVVSQVRMPTRRETVLFTWEVSLVVALLLLLRAGVASTLRWIHNRLNATRGLKSNIPYEASVFECMQRPLEFLSLFTVGTALADAVSRPLAAIGLLRHIRTLRELGIIISATWFLLRWIDRIRSRFAVDKRIDKAQVDATSRIATVVTFVASLLISLDTIGINVQTVLAFGGIGGVAIGFAGREIISNFFGGFMIYVTRPFSVGEWIRSIEERELNGTVEDIGWYLTRVRTWDKRPLYIPNSRFSTLIVENGSRMDNRRVLHTLHLRHEDMPVVPTIVAAMEQLLMNHPELDPRQHRLAYVDSFGEYSVKIWLSCYTKSVFLYDYRRVQQDILVKCYDIIRANGARLATITLRDVRPGVDTDRYGPFGSKATFGQATIGVQTPESATNYPRVNSDVPGAPQYGQPNPLVRFNTIESGVDLSMFGQPTVPSGVPANANVNADARATSTTGSSIADEIGPPATNREAPSQRSTSVAAVAAAAAALAAARRNASRIEGNEKAVTQRPMGQTDGCETVATSLDGLGASNAPSGEMKITAAKPGRSAQAAAANASAAQAANANVAKSIGNKPAEEAISGSEKPMAQKAMSKTDSSESGASSAPSGEMKITAAKPIRSAQTTAASTSAAQVTNVSATKGAGNKGVDTGVSTGGTHMARGKGEDHVAGSRPAVGGQTAAPSPAGMKISKARRPVSAPQGSIEGEKEEGGDKVVAKEFSGAQSEGIELLNSSAEVKVVPTASSQQMKISSAKPPRSGPTGQAGSSVAAAGANPGTGSVPRAGENAMLGGASQATQGLSDDLVVPQKTAMSRQGSSSLPGEMKISKARKPISVPPIIGPDGKVKGSEQTSGAVNSSKPPGTASPSPAKPVEDGSIES